MSARPPLSLLAWTAVAVVLFILAPAPPPPPAMSEEQRAVQQRHVDFIVRETQRWEREHGDFVIPWAQAQGHLAIIIDDVGRELHAFEKLHSLRFALTFSILPGSVYAVGAQLRLRQDRRRPRELWLHLPMEPLDATQMQRGLEAQEDFLLSVDEPQVLRAKVEKALARVPVAVGINNHMGSRLSTDATAMQAVASVVAERGLLFLDSRTTAESVALEAALAAGVPAGARKVFLDHDPTPRAIEQALERAVREAQLRPVVAIGHPSMQLYEVLHRKLPEYHRAGIGIYPASWIVTYGGEAAAGP